MRAVMRGKAGRRAIKEHEAMTNEDMLARLVAQAENEGGDLVTLRKRFGRGPRVGPYGPVRR
jgi:hypothetical protein